MKGFRYIGALVLFLGIVQATFALEQNEKFWLGFNVQNPLQHDNQWFYLFDGQLRMINKPNPWQEAWVESGLGYTLFPNKSLAIAYRWSGQNPNNNFYQENRIWEQLGWNVLEDARNRITSRTRLEELYRGNESRIAVRFRQRVLWESLRLYFSCFNPVVHDEVFLQLNKTNYTPHSLFSQNRLFLGVYYYTSTRSYWELGYINQYVMNTPINSQHQMNHILSVTYNVF